MKTNWLWDTRLSEKKVKEILKNGDHPKFNIYAEKLFSRISDPTITFSFVNKIIFCHKWPIIKKRLAKDRWIRNRIIFWQTIYETVCNDLKRQGIKIREPIRTRIPPERIKIAHQIRNMRMKLGYTQRDLAKKLGVIQQYISRIETGMENVSIDTLKKIADVLGRNLTIKLG